MQTVVILHYLGEMYKCSFSIVLIVTAVSCCVVEVKMFIKVSADQWECFMFTCCVYKPRMQKDWREVAVTFMVSGYLC